MGAYYPEFIIRIQTNQILSKGEWTTLLDEMDTAFCDSLSLCSSFTNVIYESSLDYVYFNLNDLKRDLNEYRVAFLYLSLKFPEYDFFVIRKSYLQFEYEENFFKGGKVITKKAEIVFPQWEEGELKEIGIKNKDYFEDFLS
jgi:hypothetical protein